MPLSNKTPSAGIVLSVVVLAVPIVLALNKVVPSSGAPFMNSIVPAVPPETIDIPLSLILLLPCIAWAHSDPEPTVMLAAYCAEHSTAETVRNNFAPATASAEPVEVITSVMASPNTSVPVIVHVFPLSPVPAVVTVTFLAAPPAKVVLAIVAEVSGLAAVTKRSASAAFSSLTVKAETSEFAEWLI